MLVLVRGIGDMEDERGGRDGRAEDRILPLARGERGVDRGAEGDRTRDVRGRHARAAVRGVGVDRDRRPDAHAGGWYFCFG